MEDTTDSEEDGLPANIALVTCCESLRDALDRGLVILSMNLPYWHVQEAGRHMLYVEAASLAHVAAELRAFEAEQSEWAASRHDPALREYPASFYVPYALTLILVASFILQAAYAPGYSQTGRMDSVGLFDRREWWRPLTALFLHADAVHLLGNLTFGLWYGSLVNRALGTLLGWGLVLLSGVLGNLLVAAIHYPQPHLSLGASTAVFGALGLLVAEGLIHRWQQRWLSRLAPLMVPLVAGGVLLGLTGGFDNPQTDGMAHVMGFLTGIVLGLIACCLQRPSNKAHLTSD